MMFIDTSVPVPIVTEVDPVTPKADAVTVSVPAFFACRIPLLRMFARLFFEERHVTFVNEAVLPSLYVPTAENFSEVPFCTRPFDGEIAIETSVTLETVSCVEVLTGPSIAVIVVVPVERLEASPRFVIVATPGAEELHNTTSVITCVELSLNVPVAVNCFVASFGIDEFNGVIARDTSVAVLTVTEVLAATVPDTTLTVAVPGPIATANPLWSIFKTVSELEDHSAETNTCVLPSSKLPTAVNCCCVLLAIVTFVGVSVMDCRWAGTTVITEASVNVPAVAVMVVVPAASVVASPLLSIVATLVFDEVHVMPVTKS